MRYITRFDLKPLLGLLVILAIAYFAPALLTVCAVLAVLRKVYVVAVWLRNTDTSRAARRAKRQLLLNKEI